VLKYAYLTQAPVSLSIQEEIFQCWLEKG
jgi:hypothetical protein